MVSKPTAITAFGETYLIVSEVWFPAKTVFVGVVGKVGVVSSCCIPLLTSVEWARLHFFVQLPLLRLWPSIVLNAHIE